MLEVAQPQRKAPVPLDNRPGQRFVRQRDRRLGGVVGHENRAHGHVLVTNVGVRVCRQNHAVGVHGEFADVRRRICRKNDIVVRRRADADLAVVQPVEADEVQEAPRALEALDPLCAPFENFGFVDERVDGRLARSTGGDGQHDGRYGQWNCDTLHATDTKPCVP